MTLLATADLAHANNKGAANLMMLAQVFMEAMNADPDAVQAALWGGAGGRGR